MISIFKIVFITLLQHVRGQSALCCQINVCMYVCMYVKITSQGQIFSEGSRSLGEVTSYFVAGSEIHL